jgi:hypothetical protein
MRQINTLLFFILLFIIASCDKENEDPEIPDSKVVINELLPINQNTGSDQNGEFDDWIELYNQSEEDVDLSGYFLTDSKKMPDKWKFPEGTTISGLGYLIVWADGDTLQAGLHTNYKLSSDGEKVLLLTPDFNIVDETEFPSTVLPQSWARIPNGTGDFQWSVPTFNGPND